MMARSVIVVCLVWMLLIAPLATSFRNSFYKGHCSRPTSTTTGTGSGLWGIRKSIIISESEKESNRKFRRTIFTTADWKKHRSSTRYFSELSSMHKSVVLRGLIIQAFWVTFFSSCMTIYNMMCEAKVLPWGFPLFSLPPLPFSLTSSALGLLLVFRTNAAYSRWKDARIAWALIAARSFDLMRQTVTWIKDDGLRISMISYTAAFARCLKWQLGHQGNDKRLKDDLMNILSTAEVDALLKSRNRPQYALLRLSHLIQSTNALANIQTHLDRSVCEISTAMTTCDRIFSTPIPLVYTRHTARFLLLWLLFVPMSLYHELAWSKKWMVPLITFMNSIFLFGIEDLGVQIEEPFSILPLANICADIQKMGEDALSDVGVQWPTDNSSAAVTAVSGYIAEAGTLAGPESNGDKLKSSEAVSVVPSAIGKSIDTMQLVTL